MIPPGLRCLWSEVIFKGKNLRGTEKTDPSIKETTSRAISIAKQRHMTCKIGIFCKFSKLLFLKLAFPRLNVQRPRLRLSNPYFANFIYYLTVMNMEKKFKKSWKASGYMS